MALPTVTSVRVFATVLESLSLLLTAWRLYFRLRIGRFWWEDAWAAILLFSGILWIISQWMFALTNGLTSIVSSWIYSLGFTCTVTLARMSILFSIIRITHGRPRFLKFAYACVVFFAACWIILIVEKVYQCASDSSWHDAPDSPVNPFCYVKSQFTIFELVTDCVAVSILVALPLRMFWRVKLPRRQRRMILSIFASSILLAFGTLFHNISQAVSSYIVAVAAINVQICLSIFVCNLLVVVTFLYRFLLHSRGTMQESRSTSDDDDFTTPPTRSPMSLTSVDVDGSSFTREITDVSRSA